MISPAEAERLVLGSIRPIGREDCGIGRAQGRVLAGEVSADRDLPPFDRVMMDGYALRASSLVAGIRDFKVEAVQAAGMRAAKLGPGKDACVEVMTGAVLPMGADCVVPCEHARREGPGVRLQAAPGEFKPGNAIHLRGTDLRAGDLAVPAGIRLTGREIAVAASCGCATVSVSRLPEIAVVTTGDELVQVGSPVAPHQIRRSNDFAIQASLASSGYPNAELCHLHDMLHEIEHMLWHIIAEYDFVLVTGGVSKGKFDYLPAELDRQGVRKVFQGVAQRPGKPFWFGLSSRQTPVFALPGNPVSAFTCLHRYVLPALEKASGLSPLPHPVAALASPVPADPEFTRFIPVRLSVGPGAERIAAPVLVNTSGDCAGLVGTDGFVELPAGRAGFSAGHVAPLWMWV